jgi:hypothetical protein
MHDVTRVGSDAWGCVMGGVTRSATGWTFEDISRAFREGKLTEFQVLQHFDYGQPDDTPMPLMKWVVRYQMTGMGTLLLEAIRSNAAWRAWCDGEMGRASDSDARGVYDGRAGHIV